MIMPMLRHVAPAGAPIGPADLARWAGTAFSGREPGDILTEAIEGRFGLRHSFLTSTGRAGLTLLLRALHRIGGGERDEVILPSYTCYSVAASVVKAGLHVRLVDVRPETLDYDQQQLAEVDATRALAIVATNLYGLPNDLPALSTFARDAGLFLVDDAAQAMGATIGGRPSGTWGDAGLFSLDKGKNVSAIDGGIVVTNSDAVAEAMTHEVRGLPAPGAVHSGAGIMKALGYALLLHPSLYWIPTRIPQLALGETVFTTEFPLERPSRALSALAGTMLGHLDDFTGARIANAEALLLGLARVSGIDAVTPLPGGQPVYLRLPVLCADESMRQRALAALTGAGIGASRSYPQSLADVPEVRAAGRGRFEALEGGRDVARRIVTLPTHPFVAGHDLNRMIDVLHEVADTRGTH